MNRSIFHIFVFLIAIAAAIPLSAQEYFRPARVMVSSVPASGIAKAPISNVILKASALQMRLQEFIVTSADGEADSSALLDQDYLIKSVYEITGDELTIEIQALKAGSGSLITSARWEGRLSIDLDAEVQNLIRDEIVPALPQAIGMSRRQTEKAADAGEAWAVTALSADKPDEARESKENEQSSGSWSLEIGAQIYLPLSGTATFAEIGYGGRFAFGYAFNGKALSISPRLILGGLWLPTETINNTDLLIAPLGIDVKFSSATSRILFPFLRLGGGVSWLMIFPEIGEAEGKIIPYAEAGLGMDIQITKTAYVVFDVAFSAQFEESLILYGIAPGLSLGLRL